MTLLAVNFKRRWCKETRIRDKSNLVTNRCMGVAGGGRKCLYVVGAAEDMPEPQLPRRALRAFIAAQLVEVYTDDLSKLFLVFAFSHLVFSDIITNTQSSRFFKLPMEFLRYKVSVLSWEFGNSIRTFLLGFWYRYRYKRKYKERDPFMYSVMGIYFTEAKTSFSCHLIRSPISRGLMK